MLRSDILGKQSNTNKKGNVHLCIWIENQFLFNGIF